MLFFVIVNHFSHFEKRFFPCLRKKPAAVRSGCSAPPHTERHTARSAGETPRAHSVQPSAVHSSIYSRVRPSSDTSPAANRPYSAAAVNSTSANHAQRPMWSRRPPAISYSRPRAAPSSRHHPASFICTSTGSSISGTVWRKSPLPAPHPRTQTRSPCRRCEAPPPPSRAFRHAVRCRG